MVELLENSSYDSAEDLAKDVIRLVGELFAEREWYAYAYRDKPGGLVLPWGPLSSESEVKKFATKVALGGEHKAVKLYSTGSMLTRLSELEKGLLKTCLDCQHPLGTHEHPKMSGRCVVNTCACKEARKK